MTLRNEPHDRLAFTANENAQSAPHRNCLRQLSERYLQGQTTSQSRALKKQSQSAEWLRCWRPASRPDKGGGRLTIGRRFYNLSPWASGPRTVMKTPPGMRLVSPHIRLLAIPLFSRSCGTFSMVPHRLKNKANSRERLKDASRIPV